MEDMLTNRDDAKEASDAYIEAFVSKNSQRVSNAFYLLEITVHRSERKAIPWRLCCVVKKRGTRVKKSDQRFTDE